MMDDGVVSPESASPPLKCHHAEKEEVHSSAEAEGGAEATQRLNPDFVKLPKYPFRANYNDHFETNIEALRHLVPSLVALQAATRPNSASDNFWLYDPFYCSGKVQLLWRKLGFPNVHHELRDFYEDAKKGYMPSNYDILVTNPPYSADHIQRTLDILVATKKPFALLVPEYVASKQWYIELVRRCFTQSTLYAKPGVLEIAKKSQPAAASGPRGAVVTARSVDFTSHPLLQGIVLTSSGHEPEANRDPSAAAADGTAEPVKRRRKRYASRVRHEPLGPEPFYLLPKRRYDFTHPHGAGNAHSHFCSMWIVWCGSRHAEVLLAAKSAAALANADDRCSVYCGLLELEHRASSKSRKNQAR